MNYMDWKKERVRLLVIFLGLQALLAIFLGLRFGLGAAAVSLGSGCCAAFGFWVTEQLIGLFSGVKKANLSAIVVLAACKLGWWVGLFILARNIGSQEKLYVAFSIATILATILIAALLRHGLPQITDAPTRRDS